MASAYTITGATTIKRNADGAFIPTDPANKDFVEYEAWVAAGNVADPAPVPPKPTMISAGDFLARFTAAEEQAIQGAAATNVGIALGLTMGLAKGQIALVGDPTVTAWMNALVTANCITSARM